MNKLFRAALSKGSQNKRLNLAEARALINIVAPDELYLLMDSALQNRKKRFGNKATFICNLTVNPSNICEGNCSFCHFSRKAGEEGAYILNESDIIEKIAKINPSEIHIVGGLNKHWNFTRYLGFIKTLSSRWPEMFIKSFSAVEIDYFSETEDKPPSYILKSFKDAGLGAMPGGGAEIFSERMRKKYFPNKISSKKWIDIHKTAHRTGITTNATMLYGFGETNDEILEHLFILRKTQDDTGGFSSFIPLAYQPAKNSKNEKGPSVLENLKIVALSRLVLDNFKHIKAYWPMIGLETASAALSWGADDLDGTLGEELIAHAGNASSPKSTTQQLMIQTISRGGFIPVERAGDFKGCVKNPADFCKWSH